MTWIHKAKAAFVAFLVSLKKPATIRKFLSFVAGVASALIANGVLSGTQLVVANVLVIVLTGAGIYSFSNAPLAQ